MRTALVIDDERTIRSIVCMSLEHTGQWRTIQVDDGVHAVASARKFAPDVILLDVMMPILDGEATLAALAAEPDLAGIPVIFMTARVNPPTTAHYLGLGAAGVVPKPFDPMNLAQIIDAALARLTDGPAA